MLPPAKKTASDVEITNDAVPFLLEIGTEELPPSDLAAALSQLEVQVPALLDELHLAHGEIQIMGTPAPPGGSR